MLQIFTVLFDLCDAKNAARTFFDKNLQKSQVSLNPHDDIADGVFPLTCFPFASAEAIFKPCTFSTSVMDKSDLMIILF